MAKTYTFTKAQLLDLKRHWFDVGCYHVGRFGFGFSGGDSPFEDQDQVKELHDKCFKSCLKHEPGFFDKNKRRIP